VDESRCRVGQDDVRKLFADHCSSLDDVTVASVGAKHYPRAIQASGGGYRLGRLAFGAAHGRALYELMGRGCEAVRHWGNVYSFLQGVRPKLTRLDSCVDFFEGEVTLDGALGLFKAGAFDRRGFHPRHSMVGPWGEVDQREGRTLYVEGGAWKLCIYEKGMKEGGLRDWVRVEVRTFSEAGLDLSAMVFPNDHWRAYVGPWAKFVEEGVAVVRLKAQRRSLALLRRVEYAAKAAGGLVACLLANGLTTGQVCRLLAGELPGERLDAFELRAVVDRFGS
jgi:DNA relaxase NicK